MVVEVGCKLLPDVVMFISLIPFIITGRNLRKDVIRKLAGSNKSKDHRIS
jgi:hypothetical protein